VRRFLDDTNAQIDAASILLPYCRSAELGGDRSRRSSLCKVQSTQVFCKRHTCVCSCTSTSCLLPLTLKGKDLSPVLKVMNLMPLRRKGEKFCSYRKYSIIRRTGGTWRYVTSGVQLIAARRRGDQYALIRCAKARRPVLQPTNGV
jgi:hypothetical protein